LRGFFFRLRLPLLRDFLPRFLALTPVVAFQTVLFFARRCFICFA
jgi:hypothetical protein